MNFSRLQERVRLELLRRIKRGTLSVSLLARQTGMGQPHISNFLHGRRQLSLKTLDKILAAQRLAVEDLMPAGQESGRGEWSGLQGDQVVEQSQLPLVSHAVAAHEQYIRLSSIVSMLPLPASELEKLRPRCTAARRQWERFLALRITAEEAEPMAPLLRPDAIVVLDRHYNSFAAYTPGATNLYAVRHNAGLVLRYADLRNGWLVMRAHDASIPAEVLEAEPGESVNDLLIGRVALILNMV
jgi:transcriptional regulator with XRE-family HTH domain